MRASGAHLLDELLAARRQILRNLGRVVAEIRRLAFQMLSLRLQVAAEPGARLRREQQTCRRASRCPDDEPDRYAAHGAGPCDGERIALAAPGMHLGSTAE